MRLLLAEDDQLLGDGLRAGLRALGFQVDWVRDGVAAERELLNQTYTAAILDLGLPRVDGIDVLQSLRNRGVATPVLVLTARDSLAERVGTLHEGADDFLPKPFALAELEARLGALIRRSRGRTQPRLACGPLQFDTAARQFTLAGEPLALSPREHGLLRALIVRSGEPMGRAQLLERVFGDEEEVQPAALDVLMHRLRRRLEGSGVHIRTYRGLGHALEPDPGAGGAAP